MSTTRIFAVLPLIASALMVPASFGAPVEKPATVAPKPDHTERVQPRKDRKQSAKKHRAVTREHRHAHRTVRYIREHRAFGSACASACDYCRALSPVARVERVVRPDCPPDFADAWYARARLAWVGPTRCYPFQPNGFYPSPVYNNLRQLPAAAPDAEVEVIGGNWEK